MARPQVEDGHIKIACELGEALARVNLSAYESRVLWCIFRKTYGWNKKSDRISYSQFEEVTHIDRRNIGRTIKILLVRQMITCQGDGQQLEYAIQKDYELWKDVGQPPLSKETTKPLSNQTILPLGSTIVPLDNGEPLSLRDELLSLRDELLSKETTKPLSNQTTTKAIKHITKAYNKSIYVIPEWINKDTWEAFLEMRRSIKQPPTDYAIRLIVKKLEGYKSDGDDPNEVLNQSIINSWKGVFSLRGNVREDTGHLNAGGIDPDKYIKGKYGHCVKR